MARKTLEISKLTHIAAVVAAGLALLGGSPVAAVGFDASLYYNNDIIFYDPNDCVEPGSGALGSYDGSSTAGLSSEQSEFVDLYHDIAVNLSIEYGIPWETVMAQGILESAAGSSYFAQDRNNFFGIGAFDSNPNNAFSYATPEEGWRGYYENIRITSVYRANGAFNYPDDPYAYAQAIKNAGYATDPEYVPKLTVLIDAIIRRAEEKGWETSAELVVSHPEMVENAEKNAQGQGGEADLSGDSTALDECCVTGSDIRWEDGWIVSGMPGYEKESAIDSTSFTLTDDAWKGEYSTGGKPNKILLHNTEGGNGDGTSGLALYSGGFPAHFTIDLVNRKVYQHLPINKPSCAIVGDAAAGVQIEIIGFSTEANADSEFYLFNYGDEEWEYLATLLKGISAETGIPLASSVNWAPGTPRLSEADFANYEGVLGHMHAPNNDHVDPGDIWTRVEKAINAVGGGGTEYCEAGIKIGGLNEEEARAILEQFIAVADQHPPENGDANYKGYAFGNFCHDGPFYNCVAFSRWFVIEYTTVPEAASCAGPGYTIASCMAGKSDSFKMSDEPKAYSVFSYGTGCSGTAADGCSNHTGVVVNVNEDKSIDVLQTGCSGGRDYTVSTGYQNIPYETWHGYYEFAQIDDDIIKKG